ncbi:peptide chain release factor N(5)-glutamine methyltransferase [Polaribacter septentrionalilitoris]|uniref:peptide chain release factor N(5)-glutamine methyltransferase n=1 Tax=Polaribacter septentrionalilitoris TaxID=2494657 RepID=UPI00135878B3|nr:peptide chain release factor N(5)-glutamine methyltransferase [Polaribacter septentrionalilitoris]
MMLKEFKIFFSNELADVFPKTEVDTFFFLLIEQKLNLQRVDTVLQPDFIIVDDQLLEFKNIIKRLQKEEPIQYILGNTEFFGLPFQVNKHTLIPRPETEELVEWILSEVKQLQILSNHKLKILDIGTGTGCIPITLAKNLKNVEVSAIDVSKKALKIAQQNALLNNVEIHFLEVDILKANKLPQQYDIIVSNPPYVRELEKEEIKNNVLQNEPHLALFVDDNNPLIFYNKITDLAKKHLTTNGLLFFEINQYLGNETLEMIRQKRLQDIELKKDFFGNDRMLKASLSTGL